jgi:hypothetical protein
MVQTKAKIDNGDGTRSMTYPCKKCKKLPEWGAAFLVCPSGCYETDYNIPLGASVREWNKVNK